VRNVKSRKIVKAETLVKWWDTALCALVCFVTIALVLTSGCTAAQARQDFHRASATALGVVTAALDHHELVDVAKVELQAAADKATDPETAAKVGKALEHVNAGSLERAQAILVETTAASSAKRDQ
jgi:predicted negative regulator of RcsB-dependent stress response